MNALLKITQNKKNVVPAASRHETRVQKEHTRNAHVYTLSKNINAPCKIFM